MSVCQFDYRLPASPDRLLRALRADFARFGGVVTGAGEEGAAEGFGEFSLPTPLGDFSGTYEVTGSGADSCAVRIELEQKPMFVPCSAVGEHLSRRLQKAAAAR